MAMSAQALRALQVGKILGSDDVKETYRRTFVGPLWITIGLAVQIAMIGIVFSLIFGTEISTYLPYLAISLVMWNLLQQTVNEGASAFIGSERLIKQMPLPFLSYVFRVVWKQTFIFGHNFLVIPAVFLIFRYELTWYALFAPVGLILVLANLTWISAIVALVSSRFRDVPPIVQSLMTMAFYVSPIIWLPEAIPASYRDIILGLNPVFHMMELVRRPLLGELPGLSSLAIVATTALLGSLLARFLLRRYRHRIPFWV